jgi:hypothetical protein
MIRRVLNRAPISRGQLALYRLLYEAGEQGLLTHEIEQALAIAPIQFSGLTGALGNRVSHTKELGPSRRLGITLLFNITKEKHEYRYSLLPVFRQVLKEDGVLKKSP